MIRGDYRIPNQLFPPSNLLCQFFIDQLFCKDLIVTGRMTISSSFATCFAVN
jgi:hypothetical protein